MQSKARSADVRRGRALVILMLLLGGLCVPLSMPQIRWRAELVLLLATGRIPDLQMRELLYFMTPGAGQPEVRRLLTTRNPYAVIHVPANADATAGAASFGSLCASCHGPSGSGADGPALFGRDFIHGNSDWSLYRAIHLGVPGSTMPAHALTPAQIWSLVAYIRSIDVAHDPAAQAAAGKVAGVDVPAAELAATSLPSNDWLTYSGSYSSARHSTLTQIDASNVGRLAVRWIRQVDSDAHRIECSPLVRNGVMFVTVPLGQVMALDATTGHTLWTHTHHFTLEAGGEGPGGQSRGVALLGDKVFHATWDAKLEALSATTGNVLWQTTVADYPRSYISGAPLAFKDLVVTGIGTSKSGGRGFIAAYDANTGKERWRFMAIPAAGQSGSESWSGNSWMNGGGGTWMTGSYDPRTDLLYWGVGNPKPDFNTAVRKGDNLYTNSVVALRGSTGELVWHFQFTPQDSHDWDSNQVPVIADRQDPEEGFEKRLLWANRNGFYYVLEREAGRFRLSQPFVQQNWADRLDANGRPVLMPVSASGLGGRLMYPGARGGTNWWPASFDPQLDLLFVPVLEQGMVFFPTPSSRPSDAGRSFYRAVRALDASTGKLVWEHRYAARISDSNGSGLLSTRGGVVFGGDQTEFMALDSKSGRTLWSFETGGFVGGAPVTYTVAGEQLVTVAAGSTFITFALPGT